MSTWTSRAACRGHDPELWFSDQAADRTKARRICARCPIAADCLRDALAAEGDASEKTRSGIYAGTTPAERRRLYERHRDRAGRAA